MATVQHPVFSDVTYDVPDADVTKWTQAGWRAKGRKSETAKPAAKKSDDKADDQKKPETE